MSDTCKSFLKTLITVTSRYQIEATVAPDLAKIFNTEFGYSQDLLDIARVVQGHSQRTSYEFLDHRCRGFFEGFLEVFDKALQDCVRDGYKEPDRRSSVWEMTVGRVSGPWFLYDDAVLRRGSLVRELVIVHDGLEFARKYSPLRSPL